MPFEVGQRIGEYEVQKLLGAGGMGRVYKVRNIISNREEAMKVLLPDFASEPELAARFMAEIRTLAGLDHPNIAQLRTAFQLQNEFVMIMELVEGATLETLATESKIPLDQALEYSMQVLSALGYAHGRGVTHRDIKPANIMVTAHGLVKLMDFGIAKSTNDMALTRPGTTMGSVYYISPEQVTGGTVDARSDIYSFGVTLYEILTGRKPFQADSSYTVLHSQMNETPQPPMQVNPALPQALNDIVMHAMEKRPEARFQTAEEFRGALKALRTPHPAQGFAPAPAPAAAPVAQQQPGFAPVASAVFAPPPNQPGFTPVAVAAASVAPGGGKSRRGLWIGLGALTAILALAAVATVLPRILATHANQKTAAAAPETQTATAQPEVGIAAQPAAPASIEAPPPATTAPGGSPAPARTASSPSPSGPSSSRAAIEQARPARAPFTQPTAAAPARPSAQEIRQAHNRLMNLDARADAVRSGVQQIRGQQQAQGLDIRGDILASMTRMNGLLGEANRALAQNDIEAAGESMGRAEAEASKLEAFLGH